MEIIDLLSDLTIGEDSTHQFKRIINDVTSLATEMVAFSNSEGGRLYVGVSDQGEIIGLTSDEVRDTNLKISNAASQLVHPSINPITQNFPTESGTVIVIEIPQGLSKPYQDNDGRFWVKSGSDKRKVTSREELLRLFQFTGMIHADEGVVSKYPVEEIELGLFKRFFKRFYNMDFDSAGMPLDRTLENMNLARSGFFNLAGALLFGNDPSSVLPAFIVRAVAFPGVTITSENYLDSRDIRGRLVNQFQETVSFILSNLHHTQGTKGFNSIGDPEVPKIVVEELVMNALIHRDYYVSSPVRVLVFQDRVEIISPGSLPNNLTVENIKAGNSNYRNPVLCSFAPSVLSFRGIGSGIKRSLELYKDIDFKDDKNANTFTVVIKRQAL